jgi:Putative Flp pilus-assembly TadE/G-like
MLRSRSSFAGRYRESGQTIVLVAASMLAFMAMSALAIDVVTLFIARNEAQRAADAGAMAGAKVFVVAGYTSYPAGFGNTSLLCNGGAGLADQQATQAAIANNVAGGPPTVLATTCDFSHPENPRITVQVQQASLPTFFSRIWSRSLLTVTATATAEAYNPSGVGGVPGPLPVQVAGVKPWLLANCPVSASTAANTANCSTPFFIDNLNGGQIVNNGQVGQDIVLIEADRPNPTTTVLPTAPPQPYIFYPIDIPLNTMACPNSSLVPGCGSVGTGAIYRDNIGCFNSFQFSCNQTTVGPGSAQGVLVDHRLHTGVLPNLGSVAAQCLIHASGTSSSPNQGQDILAPQGLGQPGLISPGINNPDAAIRSASSISRSDSIITVPLFDGRNLCTTPGNQACDGNAPIVGFLQLFVTFVDPSNNVHAVVLNASGCDPNATTAPPVSGGDISPIPVRLIQ